MTSALSDWSRDRRDIIYAKPTFWEPSDPGLLRVGTSRRLRVTDETGMLLDSIIPDSIVSGSLPMIESEDSETHGPKVLASLLFSDSIKVRSLSDGHRKPHMIRG
jgi:hypothetical protein